jgi:energy-converting hydrogenase B subunit D
VKLKLKVIKSQLEGIMGGIMIEQIIDVTLAFGCLLFAASTLLSKSQFTGIVFYISLGLFVTLAWARLGAIDVAIAEAAIGAGLTGAMLLAAWRILHKRSNSTDKPEE